jgi:hypothetical protein
MSYELIKNINDILTVNILIFFLFCKNKKMVDSFKKKLDFLYIIKNTLLCNLWIITLIIMFFFFAIMIISSFYILCLNRNLGNYQIYLRYCILQKWPSI